MRIGRPDRDPEAALGVERHLHRLGQEGELFLRGEQVDLQPLGNGHRADLLLAVEEDVFTVRSLARLVRDHGDKGRRVAVINFQVAPLGDRPDPLVAVGGHDVEDFHLALGDHAVGLAVGELQVGPAAVDRITVDRAVTVEPEERLVDDRLAQSLQLGRVALRRGAVGEQGLVDHPGKLAVTILVEVDAVDRQWL